MKRSVGVAMVAGVALGITGIALGVALSRKEGREAAKRLLARTETVVGQAKERGERVARSAVEQYQALAPKAVKATETLMEALPRPVVNHKRETAEVTA